MANYDMELDLRRLAWRRKNRSHFEIIASMLEAVKDEGRVQYSLLKHTGTNSAELKKYLESLIVIGFIERDIEEGQVLYRASEKGLDFLKQYYVLLEMLLSTRVWGNRISSKRVPIRPTI